MTKKTSKQSIRINLKQKLLSSLIVAGLFSIVIFGVLYFAEHNNPFLTAWILGLIVFVMHLFMGGAK